MGNDLSQASTIRLNNIGSNSKSFTIAKSQSADDRECGWDMTYTTGEKHRDHFSLEANRCCFSLNASRSSNGVESVVLNITDSADNRIALMVTIERDRYGGLCGGFDGQFTSTRAYQNCVIETTIFSYGCSQRDGLLVLEKKKNANYENAYLMTLAHYYLTEDVGVSAVAKIHGNKGKGFGVEVEPPVIHPPTDLRMVLVQTCRSGVWTPNASYHCSGARPASTNTSASDNPVGDPTNHPLIWSKQSNKGVINSTGYTKGFQNNSIIFKNCKFLRMK